MKRLHHSQNRFLACYYLCFPQGSQYRNEGCTDLASGTIYFGYQSIPVYRFGFPTIFYYLYNIQSYISNNSIYHIGNFLYFFMELLTFTTTPYMISYDPRSRKSYRTGGCTGLANGTIYFGYRSISMHHSGFTTIFYYFIQYTKLYF